MMRVLLLCTEPWIGLKLLYCLRAARYEVDVIADRKLVFRSSRYLRKFTIRKFPCPGFPEPSFGEFVSNYCAENGIQCVLGDHINSQIIIDEMADHLGTVPRFPSLPASNLKGLNDKWLFNNVLLDNGLPGPPSNLIRGPECAFNAEVRDLGFPLIVKPLSQHSNQGVFKANTDADLINYVADGARLGEFPLMAQKYLSGHDAGYSFLASDGKILGWTLQRYHWDQDFIEFFSDDSIEKFGQDFVRQTNYTGVANIDLRVDDENRLLGVIECNPRFWGSIVASGVHGMNFVKAGIDLARGADPQTLVVGRYRQGRYYTAQALVKKWLSSPSNSDTVHSENMREILAQTTDIGPYLRRALERIKGSKVV